MGNLKQYYDSCVNKSRLFHNSCDFLVKFVDTWGWLLYDYKGPHDKGYMCVMNGFAICDGGRFIV
ncbi:hypothetical protein CHH73_09025 [Shouchella clausii]|nr:hypothetical protein CHH73_09025 [Shouchella clausii]